MAKTNGGTDPHTTEMLFYQLLEVEIGGVAVYEKALECVVDDALRREFQRSLQQTREHLIIARALLQNLGFDPDAEGPGRKMVRKLSRTLVEMMETSRAEDDPLTAQLTACECVVEAETKDHLNWQLLGEIAKHTPGQAGARLREAHEQVEEEEDRHYYHSQGWTRELWLQTLGLAAVIPPPEEPREGKGAIAAARAAGKARGSAARRLERR